MSHPWIGMRGSVPGEYGQGARRDGVVVAIGVARDGDWAGVFAYLLTDDGRVVDWPLEGLTPADPVEARRRLEEAR